MRFSPGDESKVLYGFQFAPQDETCDRNQDLPPCTLVQMVWTQPNLLCIQQQPVVQIICPVHSSGKAECSQMVADLLVILRECRLRARACI